MQFSVKVPAIIIVVVVVDDDIIIMLIILIFCVYVKEGFIQLKHRSGPFQIKLGSMCPPELKGV